jgi:plastocyanin
MLAPRLATAFAFLLTATPSFAQPGVVTIDVQNFSFAPVPIHLRAGQPVTLNFVNRSGSGHDFTAPKFFASSRIVSGAAPDGEIELAPHAMRSITLVPSAGSYKAHCSHFLHKQMGMSDLIVVN